jgi:tRNA 2-thiouridine synthesizing protein A
MACRDAIPVQFQLHWGRFWFKVRQPFLNLPNYLGEQMNFDKELDARGLNCPLPILRAKKALAEVESGQVLKILSTDPGSVKDFAAFAKQTGNELLSTAEAGGEFTFFMKKK